MNYELGIMNRKNSKVKSLLLRSLPDGRQGSSSGGKSQNDCSSAKISERNFC